MRNALMILAASAALVLVTAPAADAKGPKGAKHGYSKGVKAGWGVGHRPPGWSRGRKVGWGYSRRAPPGWR